MQYIYIYNRFLFIKTQLLSPASLVLFVSQTCLESPRSQWHDPKYCPRPPICTCSAWGKPFSCGLSGPWVWETIRWWKKNHGRIAGGDSSSKESRTRFRTRKVWSFYEGCCAHRIWEKKYVLEAVSKKLTLCLLNWKSMGSIFPWTQLPLPKPPEPQVLNLLICGHLHFKHIGQNAHVFSLLSSKVWRAPNCRWKPLRPEFQTLTLLLVFIFNMLQFTTVTCDKNASFQKQPDPLFGGGVYH